MNTHPNGFLARNFTDGYEAFYYYINEIPIAEFKELKKGLFGFQRKGYYSKRNIKSSTSMKTVKLSNLKVGDLLSIKEQCMKL